MSARERFARTAAPLLDALRDLRRHRLLWLPATAGFFWIFQEATSRYPASYIFVPDLSILVVQLATWAWLVARGLGVAALFAVPCALFCDDERRPAEAAASRLAVATALAGITALAVFLRTFWSDLIPPGAWWDAVFAIDDVARAGRFVGLHEALPLHPEGVAAPVLVYGGYLDFVRLLLRFCPSRAAALLAMNAIPASLLPAALFLLARRVTDERAAMATAFLAAVTPWPLILARWGWDQQLMSLLALLALERTAAGIEERRPGALLLGGLLAGAACHTYVAGLITAGALGAWVVVETRGRRALPFFAGLLLVAGPIALAYRSYAPGGRVSATHLTGGAGALAATAAANTLRYLGEFFFTPDRNPRHGVLDAPHQDALLVGLMLVGLGVLVRRGRPGTAARGTLVVAAASLAGGILTEPNLAPNGYRTGLAGLLALVACGAGLAAVLGSARLSPRFRRIAPALAFPLLFANGLGALLRWGFAPVTERYFGDARTIGRFAAIARPERVVIDRRLVFWGHPTSQGPAFEIRGDRPLEPLRPLRYAPPPAAGLAALDADWFVTDREPASLPGMSLSAPGHPFGGLRAVNLKRLRARTPAPR